MGHFTCPCTDDRGQENGLRDWGPTSSPCHGEAFSRKGPSVTATATSPRSSNVSFEPEGCPGGEPFLNASKLPVRLSLLQIKSLSGGCWLVSNYISHPCDVHHTLVCAQEEIKQRGASDTVKSLLVTAVFLWLQATEVNSGKPEQNRLSWETIVRKPAGSQD